jgi:hypothetical protein
MSKENAEVVRRAVEFEFSGRGGRAEAAAIFDPSFVMNPLEEEPAYGLDRFGTTSSIGGLLGISSR